MDPLFVQIQLISVNIGIIVVMMIVMGMDFVLPIDNVSVDISIKEQLAQKHMNVHKNNK